MNTSNQLIKIIFGVVVFLFSLTLAYFMAAFLSNSANLANPLDFWLTIAMMGGAYIIAGVMLAQIFSISLGFLFSADILILSALANDFGKIDQIYKTALVGIIIAILYVIAFTGRSKAAPQVQAQTPSQSLPQQ